MRHVITVYISRQVTVEMSRGQVRAPKFVSQGTGPSLSLSTQTFVGVLASAGIRKQGWRHIAGVVDTISAGRSRRRLRKVRSCLCKPVLSGTITDSFSSTYAMFRNVMGRSRGGVFGEVLVGDSYGPRMQFVTN